MVRIHVGQPIFHCVARSECVVKRCAKDFTGLSNQVCRQIKCLRDVVRIWLDFAFIDEAVGELEDVFGECI